MIYLTYYILFFPDLKNRGRNSSNMDTNDDHFRTDNLLNKPSQFPNDKVRRNVFPVNWHDSVCLVISSCFFLVPGAYGFANALYYYGVVSVITTAVSVNYWRYAVEGMRRSADLITAKVSFAIYFVSGFFFLNLRLLAIGIPGCILIIVFYMLSNRYWDKDSHLWVYFHMGFHLFVALEQFLVLYGGVQINAQKFFN